MGNDATPCVSPPVAGVGEREHEAIGPLFSRNLRRSHGARGARRAAPIRSLRRIPGRTLSILHELTSPLAAHLSSVDRDEFALDQTYPFLAVRVSKAELTSTAPVAAHALADIALFANLPPAALHALDALGPPPRLPRARK